MNLSLYLVIKNIEKPAPGVKTSKKDWRFNPENIEIFEKYSFVDRVKESDMQTSVAIIDILSKKCIKNRTGDTKENVVMHYFAKYNEVIEKTAKKWMGDQAQKYMASPAYIKLLEKMKDDAKVVEDPSYVPEATAKEIALQKANEKRLRKANKNVALADKFPKVFEESRGTVEPTLQLGYSANNE